LKRQRWSLKIRMPSACWNGLRKAKEEAEDRWQTPGMAGGVLVMFVAHTYRESDGEEVVRIISARKATPRERSMYEEGL
jgi:uncharacterized DUF497 family protein